MRQKFIAADDFENDYAEAPGYFIDDDGDEYDSLPGVVAHNAPWASVAIAVEGGFMAFATLADYESWNNQR